jgi:hypothetical protein
LPIAAFLVRRSRDFETGVTMNWKLAAGVAVLCTMVSSGSAGAQTMDGWRVAVYPVLGWVPLGIGMDVEVPPFDGGGGGAGEIIDSRFDGAFLGGVSVTNGMFRVDADVIWAAVGGDRPELPRLRVDADLIYGHAMFGVRVAPGWYAGAGVRRMALKYDIEIGDQPPFTRKPGLWDPLLGIGWHRNGQKVDFHAVFEGGGFGVGADVDLATSFKIDWRPLSHFGLTAGYNFFYFEVSDTLVQRTFTVKQTLHGPALGIGFYF